MKSRRSQAFRKLLSQLPASTQQQAENAYGQFKQDPWYPGLHFKQINPADPSVYSIRIGIHHRAVGIRKGDTITWVWIGSHADYDKLF